MVYMYDVDFDHVRIRSTDARAGVAELADAQDLKSCGVKSVPVRFRSPAFFQFYNLKVVRIAQLDRASGYGPEGRGFESSYAR